MTPYPWSWFVAGGETRGCGKIVVLVVAHVSGTEDNDVAGFPDLVYTVVVVVVVDSVVLGRGFHAVRLCKNPLNNEKKMFKVKLFKSDLV